MNHHQRIITMSYLILITLVDFMGLGIVVTLFPKLLLDPHMHMLPIAWNDHARLIFIGIFLAIYPLGQFLGAAIFGKLSDKYGRKPLLTITLTGTIAGFILSGMSIALHTTSLLFIGRLLAGLFAGNTSIAQASMIEISPSGKKARNISLLQITLGFAWVIGPPAGGWLSQSSIVSWFNYSTPFWFITLLLSLCLIMNLFMYKETLTKKIDGKIAFFDDLLDFSIVLKHKQLLYAFLIWTLFVSGWWLFEAYLPTFLQVQWSFNPGMIGTFLGSMGAGYATVQLLVLKRVSKATPYYLVVGSLAISGLAVMLIAACHSLSQLILVIGFYVVSMAFALPGLITSISNLGQHDNQGHIMGMTSSLQAFATVAMMLIGGPLFSIDEKLPIVGGGLLLVIAWGLYSVLMPKTKADDTTYLQELSHV